MLLNDGDSADVADYWYRIVTDSRHINSDGSLSEQFLKGKTVLAPPHGTRPWSHELSGCLLSLVDDAEAQGQEFIARLNEFFALKGIRPPKTLGYNGVAHSAPDRIRPGIVANVRSDVCYTPLGPPWFFVNFAHADFVTYGSDDSNLDKIRTELQNRLKFAKSPVTKDAVTGGAASKVDGSSGVKGVVSSSSIQTNIRNKP